MISGRTGSSEGVVMAGRLYSLLCATCASRSATEACITSTKGFG